MADYINQLTDDGRTIVEFLRRVFDDPKSTAAERRWAVRFLERAKRQGMKGA